MYRASSGLPPMNSDRVTRTMAATHNVFTKGSRSLVVFFFISEYLEAALAARGTRLPISRAALRGLHPVVGPISVTLLRRL